VLNKLTEEFLFFDGAMGTMLQQRGLKAGNLPELMNLHSPDVIFDIHRQYVVAGAQILTSNTFGAHRLKLKDSGYGVEEVVGAGVRLAREAVSGEKGRYVALGLGPIGTLLSPLGTLPFEEAIDIFKEQIEAGVKAGADLILIETISDLYEAKAAIIAAKEKSDLPVFCTMTFQEDGRTFTGTDVLTMVNVLQSLGVDALGVNCSLGPSQLQPIVSEILKYSSIPVMVSANAGLPRSGNVGAAYDITAEEYAREVFKMAQRGVSVIGGCCGTTPEYIRCIRQLLSGKRPIKAAKGQRISACSSSTETVVFGEGVRVIGERLNPTGKKRLQDALSSGEMDYIVREAISQKDTGSHVLNVNAGLPDLNEKEVLAKMVTEIQSVLSIPLMIDSSNIEAMESALRLYNGKPIANSVNGKQSSLDAVLPLVKKYGSMVVALTVDEEGVPRTAQKRVEIATKIIEEAKKYGIPEEDILVDPLVLTASAEQENVMETLRAIALIKAKYRVHVILGISNVSYGLPERHLLNSTYLAMALASGLDAPIVDSTRKSVRDVLDSFRVLSNEDRGGEVYINKRRGSIHVPVRKTMAQQEDIDLREIIVKGLKEAAAKKTQELLKTRSPLEVVNESIIPALDLVGEKYERGDVFLPQLIRSAETSKEAFEVIKKTLLREGLQKQSAGKILLATVQGDIHDLGKNIVKLILENYGYEIIDLGKDVPVETVVQRAREEEVNLIGLSALMTTTVLSMEETIRALQKEIPHIRVMVGGAVLTQEYADMIGAHYYAKDAREGVEIAREVFGKEKHEDHID